MKYLSPLFLALLASTIVFSVQLPQIDQTQVSFLTADSAEVAEDPDGRVTILVAGLDAEVGHGVIVQPEGESNWIEAYRNGEFPPEVIDPLRPGEYLLRGQPGDFFHLRIDRHPDRPIYDTATIQAGSDPVEPIPPDDYQDITDLSRQSSQALNDPATAAALKSAMLAKADQLTGSTLSEAQSGMVGAIMLTLAARTGPSIGVDWYNGWRVPLNEAIGKLSLTTAEQYLAAARASAKGLE